MRIAIVNDVAVAGEALRRVIVSVPGDRVAWIASDGAEAVERYPTTHPAEDSFWHHTLDQMARDGDLDAEGADLG